MEHKFRKVIEDCQKILAEYIVPEGTSQHEALSRLLGILDNRDLVILMKVDATEPKETLGGMFPDTMQALNKLTIKQSKGKSRQLKEQLHIAVEGLKFYANEEDWGCVNFGDAPRGYNRMKFNNDTKNEHGYCTAQKALQELTDKEFNELTARVK